MKKIATYSLADDIRQGDKDAFELFYRMEYNNVLYFVRNYLGDVARSEDVVQDTFCQLWAQKEHIDAGRNLRAFLFTIARNTAISVLRVRAKRGSFEDIVNLEAISGESVTDKINSLELEGLIRATFENLPPKIRESFQLSRSEGMTNREIAELKGVTEKAIEYHMKVALRLFRDKLKDYLPSI